MLQFCCWACGPWALLMAAVLFFVWLFFELFKLWTDFVAAAAGPEVVALALSFLCCSLVAGLVGPGHF